MLIPQGEPVWNTFLQSIVGIRVPGLRRRYSLFRIDNVCIFVLITTSNTVALIR
jgi:hypothetical protein